MVLRLLEKLITLLNQEKSKLLEDNWQNNAQKHKLQEKLSFIEDYQKNYLSFSDLLNNPEFQQEAQEEIQKLEVNIRDFVLKNILSTKEQDKQFFLEIKTGVGGLDAQDWSEMLLKMYLKYFENHKIKFTIVDRQGDIGIKNVTIKVFAPIYKFLGEVGVHRLVRISPFNAQGKRQTSFSSVYIYGSAQNIDIKIDKNDLQIDTFRASGAGGQHVNKTESAIRITHKPTNIIVTCQNERSQQDNKEEAMGLLRAKLFQYELEKMKKEQKITEKEDVSWGQQFRSYVLDPYKIIKDSRLDIEIKSNIKVLDVLNGDIDIFIEEHLWQKCLKHYELIIENTK